MVSMTMTTAKKITQSLGGSWHGRYGLVPGPGHSQNDRSLQITDGANGRIIVNSFAGDDWRQCRAYIASLGFKIDGNRDCKYRHDVIDRNRTKAEDKKKSEYALKIYAQCQSAAGSPVEIYLHSRGVALPADAPIFYHPACPNKKMRLPAMVCPITNIDTQEVIGLHRTFIRPDGSGKADIPKKDQKKMLGFSKGGVIRLSPQEHVTNGLGITEGIEDGLSILGIGWSPVWVALNSKGIEKIPVIAGVDSLTIFADHDTPKKDGSRPGQDSALKCARRWSQAGREVTIYTPNKRGADWNKTLSEVLL